MSDNIPLELQVEIIKRVPVKSLLQFRSVSKQWKSVIDSPDFADDYCLRQSQPRLLIRFYKFLIGKNFRKYKYVWVADDDTFQQHKIPTTALPQSVNSNSRIVGCSHGLVCLYAYDTYPPISQSPMIVVWNPWIRKCVDVPVPNVLFGRYQTVLGFGVSPQTKDPKIVKIVNSIRSPHIDNSVPIPWRVEVFTLSSGTWKTPSNNFPTRNSIIFDWDQVVLEGVIYWKAFEMIKVDGIPRSHNMIMSFDLSSEGFEEVCLPGNLARRKSNDLSISKRMESVVVLEMDEHATSCEVWMMGQGVTKSFTKLFNVTARVPSFLIVCGFMKNGEPIVDHGSDALFAYHSYSERIKDLGIFGLSEKFSVKSYMGTLLLMDL